MRGRDKIVIYGGGDFSAVVVDILEKAGRFAITGIVDDVREPGEIRFGHEILGGGALLPGLRAQGVSAGIVAIGDQAGREKLSAALDAAGLARPAVVHPFSSVAGSARLGAGAIVGHGALIGAEVEVGDGALVTDGAALGHHARIGRFCNVTSGVGVGARVHVGDHAFLGMGATVVTDVTVGAGAFVAAGALVTKDVPDGAMVAGNPARPVPRL